MQRHPTLQEVSCEPRSSDPTFTSPLGHKSGLCPPDLFPHLVGFAIPRAVTTFPSLLPRVPVRWRWQAHPQGENNVLWPQGGPPPPHLVTSPVNPFESLGGKCSSAKILLKQQHQGGQVTQDRPLWVQRGKTAKRLLGPAGPSARPAQACFHEVEGNRSRPVIAWCEANRRWTIIQPLLE